MILMLVLWNFMECSSWDLTGIKKGCKGMFYWDSSLEYEYHEYTDSEWGNDKNGDPPEVTPKNHHMHRPKPQSTFFTHMGASSFIKGRPCGNET